MCNFGAQEEWRNWRRAISSYLDVDISNDQYRLFNPTPLVFVEGYIMEYAIGGRFLKRLPQLSLNIIDGSISSYFSILNSPKRLHMIKQANKLASVLCDIEYDRLGAKEDRNKIAMEEEDHRKNKSEQK